MPRGAARALAPASALLATLATVALAGCMVGPDFVRPDPNVPERWAEAPQQDVPAPPGPSRWWQSFADPQLDALIERAVQANLDLAVAESRVREARAARRIAGAPLFPFLDAGASLSRQWQSENAGFFGGGPIGDIGGQPFTLYDVGFDASWEIDVFGGTRRGVEAADAELAASIEQRNDVLLTLIGEVARNYVELRGFQRELEVARGNVATQEDTLVLTRARYQGGLASDLDVARAEAQVRTTAARLPALDTSVRQSIHRLGVLLGEPPGTLLAELTPPLPIPPAPPGLPDGLPSDLVRRRPDVRRAERQVAAATARIGVATADLYPRFFLTGAAGLQSLDASDLFAGASKYWAVGPSIQWPIFQGGRIVGNIEVRDEQQQQALLAWRQTILAALEEVENQIVAYTRQRDRRATLAAAVDANQRAVDLAQALYTRGLTDFLDVLEAQSNLFLTQTELAQSDAQVSASLVALNKALGGGWEAFAPPAPDDDVAASGGATAVGDAGAAAGNAAS
jgi:multidrug efflux system outer membrane protein